MKTAWTMEELVKVIEKLIEKYTTSPRKEKLEEILSGELGILYFKAPASSKLQFHLAEPGGLAQHSINVFANLRKLNDAFDCKFTNETMLIVSLFHDLGKACASNMKDDHYIATNEKWKNDRGIVYEKNESDLYLTNHNRTLFVLQACDFKLSAEEYQAILLNDGQYIDENKSYKMKECQLALMLHIADRISCHFEKK